MRKIYMTLIFAALFTFVQAQNYNVLLVVDMNAEASFSDVSVAGQFQDDDALLSNIGEWTPGAHILSDDEGDGFYSILVNIPAGTYEYKFINGLAWGNDEGSGLTSDCATVGGYTNRVMTISSDTVIAYVYNSCTETSIPVSTQEVTTAASFDIAPNPLTDVARITVNNPENETLNVIITNVVGQVVRQENIVNNTIEVSRKDFEAGMYFVTVMNEFGAKVTKKLSVQY